MCPLPVSLDDLLILFRISAGKELTSWLSADTVRLCCLDFWVPFPHGVWGRKWNSFVLVPDHCLVIYVKYFVKETFLELNYFSFYFLYMLYMCFSFHAIEDLT